MKRIAENFNDFVEKVSEAERKALNTETGRAFTESFLQECLRKNPNMTSEEWQQKKSELMTVIFLSFVQEHPEAMRELAEHTYNEINQKD